MAAQGVPKSRISLTYQIKAGGQKKKVNLPLRLLLMGDLSLGTSSDRATDLDLRDVRNLDGTNLNTVMEKMAMAIDLSDVDNVVTGSGKLDGKLSITGVKSFAPATIAENVPQLKAMLLVKQVLNELQASIDNRKEFRNLIRELNDKKSEKGQILKSVLDQLGEDVANETTFDLTEKSGGAPAADGASE